MDGERQALLTAASSVSATLVPPDSATSIELAVARVPVASEQERTAASVAAAGPGPTPTAVADAPPTATAVAVALPPAAVVTAAPSAT